MEMDILTYKFGMAGSVVLGWGHSGQHRCVDLVAPGSVRGPQRGHGGVIVMMSRGHFRTVLAFLQSSNLGASETSQLSGELQRRVVSIF